MREEALRGSQDRDGRNLTERDKRDEKNDRRDGWRHPEMAYLTDSASGLFVIIGMRVRNYLNKKQQGEKREGERQRFEESARERMRDGLHFRASLQGTAGELVTVQDGQRPTNSLSEVPGDCKRVSLLEAI